MMTRKRKSHEDTKYTHTHTHEKGARAVNNNNGEGVLRVHKYTHLGNINARPDKKFGTSSSFLFFHPMQVKVLVLKL
jgi:hypothetical protein